MDTAGLSKKTLYLDTEDTQEEVGISRRQLNYWREKGLITPELGEDAKRFTAADIQRLKFIRFLIVDRSLPVEVVKQLLAEVAPRFNANPHFYRYLDLTSGHLRNTRQVYEDLWEEFGARCSEDEAVEKLYDMALLVFRILLTQHRGTAAYTEHRDRVLRVIDEMEFMARVELVVDHDFEPKDIVVRHPSLDDEEVVLQRDLKSWLMAGYTRLAKFSAAADRLRKQQGITTNIFRFWLDETPALLEKMAQPNASDSKTSDDGSVACRELGEGGNMPRTP